MTNEIILFENQEVRRLWLDEEWWFAMLDVISVLTETSNARDYWYRLKKRELNSSGIELSTFCRQLKAKAADGKYYKIDFANTENLLRIIQSIPSKNAEPFKRWLSEVGTERLQEVADPTIAIERLRELYKKLNYSEEWIETRLKGIDIRNKLTEEWKNRGVLEGLEYAVLTNEISKGTFGMTIAQYKKLKALKNENLRDHMTNLELIFNMLGEETTRQIAISQNAQGFEDNKEAAEKGGKAAGESRKRLEKTTGLEVVSKINYLKQLKKVSEKKMDT